MAAYRKFQIFALSLAFTTLSFAAQTNLSTIEQQATQLEEEIHQLEEKIAAIEEISAKDDLDSESSLKIEKSVVAATEKLPLANEENSFVMTQENPTTRAYEERSAFRVDLKQAFSGSPIIYTILGVMSMFSFSLWFYSMVRIKKTMMTSEKLLEDVRNKLIVNQYDEAAKLLETNSSVLSKMVLSLIEMRKLGHGAMLETMKAEGKRATLSFWQKLGLLSDVAIMAPMLGLLGTVLGMFYAFYDINRSIESITTLFDGLGISVGTTVAGLVVALLAMMFHSLAKFRLMSQLATVETQAQSFVPLINNRQE